MNSSIGERYPVTNVARLVVINPADETILVVRRVPNSNNNRGLLENPGGKHDVVEGYLEDFRTAATRETYEETGYETEIVGLPQIIEGYFMTARPNSTRSGFYVAQAAVARVTGGALKLNPKEHTEAIWVPKPYLQNLFHEMTPQTITALAQTGLIEPLTITK